MGCDNKENRPARLPVTLSAYLESIQEMAEREYAQQLFDIALSAARERDVADLWEARELAVSYWMLLISGVNQDDEMELATTLLRWKAFFAKDSALVVCLQSSERDDFRCASSHFGVVDCPVLVFSNSPEMKKFVKVESELLFALSKTPGAFQRFLTRLHQLIANGNTLEDTQTSLWSESFWAGLKLVYTEVKGFISFSAQLQSKIGL